MVYIVEEAFDVCFQHVVDLAYHNGLIDLPHYLMRAPSGSESIGAIQEPLLINVVQNPCHDTLHKPVFIGRYAQWPLSAVRFWDICSAYRLWFVAESLHPGNQFRHIFVQLLTIFRLGYSVYAHCFSLNLLPMLFLDASIIDAVH